MPSNRYVPALLSGTVPDETLSDRGTLCSLATFDPYPLLYLPRNPVLFVPSKGRVTINKQANYPRMNPFRFIRLKPAGDRRDRGKLLRKSQEPYWTAIKNVLTAQGASRHPFQPHSLNDLVFLLSIHRLTYDPQTPIQPPYHIGLQSGGRSALRLLPKGRLLRIKGGELIDQPEFFDGETPRGGSIESYVEDEIKAHAYLFKRTPPGFLPYNPIGFIDYKQRYNGNNIYAGLFEVYGDTRLDELLHLLRGTEETLQPIQGLKGLLRGILDQVKELSFCLGAIAGMRFSQLEQNGIPWSMKETPTNAHTGNMIVYDHAGKTTIGLCDLDAAGISIRSRLRRQELLAHERGELMLDTDQAVLISLPRDHRDNHLSYPQHQHRSIACQGFKFGYCKKRSPTLPTKDVQKIIGLARAAKHFISAEETLHEHGISYPLQCSLSMNRGRYTRFPHLSIYKRFQQTSTGLEYQWASLYMDYP